MLADPGCRLLVILGLGGVGKSRLAKVVGKQHAEQFRDGVFFVELTALQQAELIPETIAHAIHAPLQGVRSPIKQLISVLQRREVLLILDNIEHLLPEVQFCLTLLESCPELKIMFTSREPVQLYGEWTYHLQGLPVPAEADDPSSWGSESAAYGLFVQSAKRVNHHFKPSAQDKQHILGICRLVDGMPLGIEIAASLAQHLTCEEILLELRESLLPRRLHDERGSRSSLAGVLQQSWDMLTTREQQVMQHLSLFRGEFNREAASAIAGVTMADYGGLISKSMLSRNPGGNYSLHEVMHQYAAERCLTNQQHPAAAGRFVDYYLDTAATADAGIFGGEQLTNIMQLEGDYPNFRECLLLCNPQKAQPPLSPLRIEQGLKMVGSLGAFWFLANHWQEGRRWAENFLALDSAAQPSADRANALLAAGGLSVLLDDYAIAERHLTTGVQMAVSFGVVVQQARGLAATGVLRRLQGNHAGAIACCHQSMQLFESIDEEGGYQFNLGNLGHSLVDSGHYDDAVKALEECIRFNQRIGPTVSMPYALVNLGRLHWKLNEPEPAAVYLQEGIQIAEKLGILLYQAQALSTLGWIAMSRSDAAAAQQSFNQSANAYLRLGDREGLADVMKGMAAAKTQLGELTAAIQFMAVAEELTKHWQVPISKDNRAVLLDTKRHLRNGLRPAERVLYRNIGLASSPEALFANFGVSH